MQSMNKMACLIAALLLSIGISQAQQSRVYSQFFMNPFIYNPAYAGVEGHSVFFGMYRKQWSSIDGAPALSHVSFHTPLKGGLGVGFTAYNDQEGLINATAIKGSLSYLLAIDRKHYLRVGMSLGGGTKSINTDGFDSPADPAFASLSESATFSLANFGATYHFGHFNVGIALPNLVGYEIVGTESFSKIKVDPLGEALFKANYRGHVNDDIAFEPHILYRYNQNLPNQFEAALITHLKHIVWVGASYRQDAGIVALFGTKVKEKIGIGFAYDIGNSNFNDILGPTFEIHIGYHLGTKKDHAEHVSSFIKSHRKSLEERQQEQQKKLEALKAKEESENKDRLTALQESRNNRLNKDNTDSSTENNTDNNVTNPSNGNAGKPNNTDSNTNTDPNNSSKQQSTGIKTTDNGKVDNQTTEPQNNDSTKNQEVKKDDPKSTAQNISDLIEKQRIAAKNNTDDTNNGNSNTNNPNRNTSQQVVENNNSNTTKTSNTGNSTNPSNKNIGNQNDGQVVNNNNTNTTQSSNTGNSTNTGNINVIDNSKNSNSAVSNTDTGKIDTNNNVTGNDDKTGENSVITNPETYTDTNKNSKSDDKIEDNRTIEELSKSDVPKKVKKGNHLLELETGNYVIAGAFQVFDHAEDFSDELFEKGYRDVIVGYITETKLYYVVVFQSQSVDKAKRQRTLLRQREGFSKIWLLTVE